MIERHFLVPADKTNHYLLDTIKRVPAISSLDGCCAWVYLPNDSQLIAAFLIFGEMAKPFKGGLLIFRAEDDMKFEEKLKYLTDELCLKPLALRLIRFCASPEEMARVEALLPGNPVPDPRPIWIAL